MGIIKEKIKAKNLEDNSVHDVKWRLLSGKNSTEETRVWLSGAVSIFHVRNLSPLWSNLHFLSSCYTYYCFGFKLDFFSHPILDLFKLSFCFAGGMVQLSRDKKLLGDQKF